MKPTLKSNFMTVVKLMVAMSMTWSPSFVYAQATGAVSVPTAATSSPAGVYLNDPAVERERLDIQKISDSRQRCEALGKRIKDARDSLKKACQEGRAKKPLLPATASLGSAKTDAQIRNDEALKDTNAVEAKAAANNCADELMDCFEASAQVPDAESTTAGFASDVLSESTRQIFGFDVRGAQQQKAGYSSPKGCPNVTGDSVRDLQRDLERAQEDLSKLEAKKQKAQEERQKVMTDSKAAFEASIKDIKKQKLSLSDEQRKKLEASSQEDISDKNNLADAMNRLADVDAKAISADKDYADNLIKTSKAAMQATCQKQVNDAIAAAKAAGANKGSSSNLITSGSSVRDLINFTGAACLKQMATSRDTLQKAYELGVQSRERSRANIQEQITSIQSKQNRTSSFLAQIQEEDAGRAKDMANDAVTAHQNLVEAQTNAASNLTSQLQSIEQERATIQAKITRISNDLLEAKNEKIGGAANDAKSSREDYDAAINPDAPASEYFNSQSTADGKTVAVQAKNMAQACPNIPEFQIKDSSKAKPGYRPVGNSGSK